MNKLNVLLAVGLAVGLALGLVVGSLFVAQGIKELNVGAAPGGQTATFASSSLSVNVASTGVKTLFTATPGCVARIISTASSSINLSFATSSFGITVEAPGAGKGIHQAASTTVVYDAATWGCGRVGVYAFEVSSAIATSSITILELNDFR